MMQKLGRQQLASIDAPPTLEVCGWRFVGHVWVAGASFWFQCTLHNVDTDPINLALPVRACRGCSNVSTLASHGFFSCPLSAETDSINGLANAGER